MRDALRTVHLEDFEKRYPHQLSGGQQQRVAFARAIAVQPGCILFDEPLSALDALLREEMRHELTELISALGITSVFVTHDQTETMSMSDRIAVLSGGRVEQYDAPETVYHHPATEFVARFVGKSNWLSETEMFRPEAASSVLKEGRCAMSCPSKACSIQPRRSWCSACRRHLGRKNLLKRNKTDLYPFHAKIALLAIRFLHLFSVDLRDFDSLIKLLNDLFGGTALGRHFVGAPLRHSHAVAVTRAGKAYNAVFYCQVGQQCGL